MEFPISMNRKPGAETIASFAGRCKVCGKAIEKGDYIVGCWSQLPNKWQCWVKCGKYPDKNGECWHEAELHWVHETCCLF